MIKIQNFLLTFFAVIQNGPFQKQISQSKKRIANLPHLWSPLVVSLFFAIEFGFDFFQFGATGNTTIEELRLELFSFIFRCGEWQSNLPARP